MSDRAPDSQENGPTRTTKTEETLHNVQGARTLCDGREADKRILGAATGAADDANVGDDKGIDVDAAEGVTGEMVHREAEDVLEVLVCRVRREVRDCGRHGQREIVNDVGDAPNSESTSSAFDSCVASGL